MHDRSSIVKGSRKKSFDGPKRQDYTGPSTLEWRPPVTVCIAAECRHKDEVAIVMCCDWQGTTGSMLKSDDMYKIREKGKVSILLADSPAYADELIAQCTPAFQAFTLDSTQQDWDLHLDAFLTGLRAGVTRQKAKLIDAYLGRLYGFTYQEFLNGRATIGTPDERQQIWDEIRGLSLHAELILCGINKSPAEEHGFASAIVVVDSTGHVSERDHFAVLGSGGFIASAFLHQYDWTDPASLMQCLYRVYAAKVAAEKDPNVGPGTSILILAGTSRYEWSDELGNLIHEEVKSRKEPDIPFREDFLWKVRDPK